MRAVFLGQNIFALGHGVAILKSVWTEAEPPRVADAKKSKGVRDTVSDAKPKP